MALARRAGRRGGGLPWPGFVDALTALLLVLMFVLTIFMVVQFTLREAISGKDKRLEELGAEVAQLSDMLSLEEDRADALLSDRAALRASLAEQADESTRLRALLSGLGRERDALDARIGEMGARIAALIAARDAATAQAETAQARQADDHARIARLESARTRAATEAEALRLTLARLRGEISAEEEAARKAAAEAAALQALADSLESEKAEARRALAQATQGLDEAERRRLLESAAAEELRKRLAANRAELDAMALVMEEERRQAERTLTLLAAAQAAQRDLTAQRDAAQDKLSREQALLAVAQSTIGQNNEASIEQARKLAALNAQTRELRAQLAALQQTLDAARRADAQSGVQIAELGRDLNAALAREAALKKREAARLAEEAERLRRENTDLAGYRSEFFGRMRDILGGREDVRIVGDRFVFQSEVLFDTGSAALGPAGRHELSRLAGALREVLPEIPQGVDWVMRVDGHTDARGDAVFNWELSFRRALSVVRYLVETEGLPADRFAPTGFGEFRPLDTGETEDAYARNRRIELKFTER